MAKSQEEKSFGEVTRHASYTVYTSPAKLYSTYDRDYTQQLNIKVRTSPFPSSLLLLEFASKVLAMVGGVCQRITDPVQYRQQFLATQLEILRLAKLGITASNGDVQEDIINHVEAGRESYTSEQQRLDELIAHRAELNTKLTGAFPFAERHLSSTFISRYNSTFGTDDEAAIINTLRSIREIVSKHGEFLVCDENDRILEFFDIERTLTRQGKYRSPVLNKLENKITTILGGKPTDDEAAKYCDLHSDILEVASGDVSPDIVSRIVQQYITDHSVLIRETMTEVARYLIHPEFLQHISTFNFLEQVLIYRQMSRDLTKTALVEGDIEQRNAPPGMNTTIKFTSGGTATLFVGDLGTYQDIGENNTVTLRNYLAFSNGTSSMQEKEVAFKILHQIEAVRSVAALLIIPMFLKMAVAGFEPNRMGGQKYSFTEIAEQMPMGMQGAVSGAVYLSLQLQDKLEYYMPYDYRASGNESKGNTLNAKNNNILFDYILHSMSVVGEEIGVVCEKQGEKTVSIDSFPLRILSNLITECYGFDTSQHIDLSGNIEMHLEPALF